MKYLNGPVRPYLEDNITNALTDGFLEIAKLRPDNPLEFLGNYLIRKSLGKNFDE